MSHEIVTRMIGKGISPTQACFRREAYPSWKMSIVSTSLIQKRSISPYRTNLQNKRHKRKLKTIPFKSTYFKLMAKISLLHKRSISPQEVMSACSLPVVKPMMQPVNQEKDPKMKAVTRDCSLGLSSPSCEVSDAD